MAYSYVATRWKRKDRRRFRTTNAGCTLGRGLSTKITLHCMPVSLADEFTHLIRRLANGRETTFRNRSDGGPRDGSLASARLANQSA